jgi:hypothetical protein
MLLKRHTQTVRFIVRSSSTQASQNQMKRNGLPESASARKTFLWRNTQIVQALNRLLWFPGLWDGLQLGNLYKHRALHCDEEIIHYLGCVYQTWDFITLGVNAFANAC